MSVRRLTIALPVILTVTLCSCHPGDTPGAAPAAAPTFRYVKDREGGCGNLFLYKGTADDLEVLWVSADRDRLKLPDEGSRTFELAAAPAGLRVGIDLWETAPRFRAYCNDISPDTRKKATWVAKQGKLTLTLRGPAEAAEPGPKHYRASARLEGVVFEDDAGNQATLRDESIADVVVGWLPG